MSVLVNSRMDNIETYKYKKSMDFCALALGTSTQKLPDGKQYFGYSISFPINHNIKVRQGKIYANGKIKQIETMLPYYKATPKQQMEYIIHEYLPNVVTPNIENGVGIFELTKAGEIHCHLLCYDNNIYDTIDMVTLRKTICQNLTVNRIIKNKDNKRLNYIHFLNNLSEWVIYMHKEQIEGKSIIFRFTRKIK